jgi:hypothetical protein
MNFPDYCTGSLALQTNAEVLTVLFPVNLVINVCSAS